MADVSTVLLGRPTIWTREQRLNCRIASALATTALLAVAAFVPSAARAQDATWSATPGSGDFNTPGNWSTAAVPAGTAFFGTSSTTALSFSAGTTTIGGWTFNAGASNYVFTNAQALEFTGAGIVVNGGSAAITNHINGNLRFRQNSTAGDATITNDGFMNFLNSSTAGSADITNTFGLSFSGSSTAGTASITNSLALSFFGQSTAGSATITNSNTLNFNGASSAGTASISNFAVLSFLGDSTAGSANINNNGTLGFFDQSVAGRANIINNGTLGFSGQSTADNATIASNNGSVEFNLNSTAGNAKININIGTLSFLDHSTAGAAAIAVGLGDVAFRDFSTAGNATIRSFFSGTSGLDFFDSSSAGTARISNFANVSFRENSTAGSAIITTNAGDFLRFFDTSTGGDARFITNAGGSFDMSGLAAGGMNAGSIEGPGSYIFGAKALTVGSNNLSTEVSGVISGNLGSLIKIGTGILTLKGANTYTGATTVKAGTLVVDGSIVSSSLTTVNAGGTLGGSGTVGKTAINGGTLSPGNSIGTITVQGSLAMTAASTYLVEVSTTADRTHVTGAATLAGTVQAQVQPGASVTNSYTVLSADGGLGGTTFDALNLSPNFTGSLSYVGNDVILNLVSVLGLGTNLNPNQRNVATPINDVFNGGGALPPGFGALFGLTGSNLSAALSQVSGEVATGSQQTTFDAMGLFMGLLTDPFIDGRGDPVSMGSSTGASAYASQDRPRSGAVGDANAMFTKAPAVADPFAQRWSVWAAGYGGAQTTDGNAALGSNNTTSRIFGTAVGADYRLSPYTLAGFALAGGGTNFSVVNSGSGRSDLFQAGAFIRHNAGAAYFSGALAYGWQDITTNRTVTVAGLDQLRAEFNANAWSGRVEGGYRFVSPWMGGIGITPYAAGQFATFDLPAYAEQAITGTNTFALSYGAKSVTASRSELGVRTDKSFAVQDGIFTLRGRVAWAHNFNTDRSVLPTFQALPGASFVVNGAAQAADAALATASAEMKWLNGFSVAGTFEGEFSNVTESYAGKGVVRYAW